MCGIRLFAPPRAVFSVSGSHVPQCQHPHAAFPARFLAASSVRDSSFVSDPERNFIPSLRIQDSAFAPLSPDMENSLISSKDWGRIVRYVIISYDMLSDRDSVA